MKHLHSATLAALFALTSSAQAQTRDDFSSPANDVIEALAVQPDGKIWVGGAFTTLDGQVNQGLARVRADGSLDLAFNPGAPDFSYQPQIIGIVIQPDGKVVVGGWFTSFAGIARTNIVRLNANGTLDATFNLNFVPDLVSCLALQADGKILAGSGINVYRINPDGSRDTGFNVAVQGNSINNQAPGNVYALAIQPDGRILIAGNFYNLVGQPPGSNPELARVNTNGTVDASFHYSLAWVYPAYDGPVTAVTVQPDGKILVGEATLSNVHQQLGIAWGVARLTSTGALDVPVANYYDFDRGVNTLALQSDGKILVGGGPRLSRLNADLTLDTTYTNAWENTVVNVMALQPDGKLLFGNPPGRLNNTAPATQSLSLSPAGLTITWLRGGSSPEVWRTIFEYSTDQGTNWIAAGAGVGTRIAGGWRRTGVSIPTNANIRARGFVGGGDSSAWFVESIIGPALMIGQPDGRTNNAGTVARFFVTAGGTSLTYQWLKNGTNLPDGGTIAGAQTSTLALSNVLNADAAQYSVVISNYAGSITSRVVHLAVADPFISIQPTNALGLLAGQTAVMRVTAAGTQPAYRWFKDGTSIFDSENASGTASSTLVITNLNGGNAGNYWAMVSNSFGSVTSTLSVLSVIDPFMVTNPSNLWVSPGQTANFSAAAAGTALSYQWMKNNEDIAGETNATLTITNAQVENNGAYGVAVSGTYGTTNSAAASLAVTVATPLPFEAAVLNPTNSQEYIYAALFQPDGKILVAGQFAQLGAHGSWFGRTNIGRLNADGTVDLNFNPPAPSWTVFCLAQQTDGKVLVGGWFSMMDSVSRYGIARLNANGTLDDTFQNGMGGVTNNGFSGLAGPVYAMAVQPDGKVLIGGNFDRVNGTIRGSIARLNTDGSLDTGFQDGMTGVTTMDVYSNVSYGLVYSIVLQPDGKIIVGGGFNKVNGTSRSSIARLNANGSLDTSFQNGMAGAMYLDYLGSISSIALQPDGRMVIGGGFTSVNGVARNYIARLNSDGGLDATYDPFPDPLHSAQAGFPGRLAQQTDGKLIGLVTVFTNFVVGTIRISASGAVDPGFSVNADAPAATMLSDDGKILVASYVHDVNGQPSSGLCLLNNDPATQNLSRSNSTVTWLRGGTSPEVYRTTFELSTNGGATWNSLGTGTRMAGGWRLTSLSSTLTNAGPMIRARGFASTGDWFVERLLNLAPANPMILVNDGQFGVVSNRFGFNYTGQSNQVVVIEGSTNMLNWFPLKTNTPGFAPVFFSDPNWTNFPSRFYRARVQ